MTKAKRQSTHKQYNSYLIAWFDYCQQYDLSPTEATVQEALAFIEHIRQSRKLSYSATNTVRSSLSSILKGPDGKPFGQHDFVKLYMKGVFNSQPPVPKYFDTWDPDTVLNLLKKWSPASKIDFKHLTLKVAFLILLVSGQRVQTLAFLDISNMKQSDSSFTFIIDKLLKQTRPGFKNPVIKLTAYAPDRRICVKRYLNEYLKRTETLRNNSTALLLTHQAPHKPASKDTIARWVRNVLHEAGIDTTKYSAHSVRAASVSAAKRGGAAVQEILNTAGWASSSVFAKYYDKYIDKSVPFHVAVLGH